MIPAMAWRTLLPAPAPACIAALHRIAASDGSDELCYPPDAFAGLCRYWRDTCDVVPLGELIGRLAAGTGLGRRCLAITFDDGYADNIEIAAPILLRYRLPATFFVTTAFIGTRRHFPWDSGIAPPRLMRWDELRQLQAAGFTIGAHTATHRRISLLPPASLRRELTASRSRIERELGTPAWDFAYPFGGERDCDAHARAAVRAAGFRCCCGCHGGVVRPGDTPFELRRIAVSPRYHRRPRDWARDLLHQSWRAVGNRAGESP